MAIESQGTKLFWSSSTAASTSADTALIGEVTDFTGPGGQAAVIDVTNLLSTAKEKLIGLRDEGQLSMTLNFSATDKAQENLRVDRAARTKKRVTMKFVDTNTAIAIFKGYCLSYSISGAVDNKITANAVIEITGAVTYSTA